MNNFESQAKFIDQIKNIIYQNEIEIGRPKTYYISTLGCQMNEHDSEKLSGMLNLMGYIETQDKDESDIIIYNTCCVRENAEQKLYGHLGALKSLKKSNPNLVIAVCGCMMQQEEVIKEIKRKYKHVDIIFGTHNLYMFPEYLLKVLTSGKHSFQILNTDGKIIENVPVLRKDKFRAWVTVMYGCNNFCSYCIVPFVRGRERSRKHEDIINEIQKLAEEGCKEVTLLGQNVNSYGKDLDNGISFAKLLKEVNDVDGIERIRFVTSHPKDLSDELIYAMRDLEKVCEHLHLPFQAGSNKVLSEMNRKYTKEQYLSLVEKIKREIPKVSLTTDIIVGFPGETEEDFEDTLDVIQKVDFDMAFTFLYSVRKGTRAANMQNMIPENVMKSRFDKLVEIQTNISKDVNYQMLEKEVEVLVEGFSKKDINRLTGRTRTNKLVHFDGNEELIGKIVNVKINDAKTWSLEGYIV